MVTDNDIRAMFRAFAHQNPIMALEFLVGAMEKRLRDGECSPQEMEEIRQLRHEALEVLARENAIEVEDTEDWDA